MDTFNSPNSQMGVEVNYKLRNWWIDIKRNYEREIRQLLGGLTYLIFVIPNPHLIRALLEFWDPVRMVFKFVDFDLAPTIEEISGFIDMPYHECEMIVPYKLSSREFLQSLGMKSNTTLPSLDLGWIHFDFLYSLFGRVDSYYSFIDEFECSVEEWETYRLNVFAIALLGSLALCIREYYIWILKEVKDRKLSGEEYYGLTDERENIWARNTMIYHTRSKDALPSLPNENRKGKWKATNEKELEEEVSDMHWWAKMLLSVDPTLETNIDKPPYLTTRLLNPPLQAPQYQTPLHQVPWYCAPLIPFQIPPYQMPPSQKPPLPYQKPTYHVHNVKTLTQKHIRKNLFNVEKRPIKIYTPLTEPIDKFYEKLRIAGHIAPICEIRMNTRARWFEPFKVCAYHSGMKGHTIEECRDLKDKIQQLIDTKIICLEEFAPTVNVQKFTSTNFQIRLAPFKFKFSTFKQGKYPC
ncbi:hypothetical protein KY289_001278 [Solanum tuberosum]|nr:hypothetical protein KY289_001278 [Solanum tuberosum]